MKHLKTWAAAVAALTLTGAAQAALIDRGGGLIYDSAQNLTWMSDLHYAATSGYDADNRMTWVEAQAWAAGLVYGGFDDWRLPELNPADATCSAYIYPDGGWGPQPWGYNCSQGEMSRLFVIELGKDYHDLVVDTAEQLANRALFTGYGPLVYWSGTSYAPDPTQAWAYNPGTVFQRMGVKTYEMMVMAVRDGDVVTPVPEPASLALVMLGLGATALTKRRQPR